MCTTDTIESWKKRAAQVFTPSYKPAPLLAERGKGSRLWDAEGCEYIDFGAGIGVGALGHGEPRVLKAIQEQADAFCHTANVVYHRPSIELAEKLTSICFGERVFFTNSGTEAMEASLKTARRYFFHQGAPREEFVSTHKSFHGRSFGALSITGQPHFHEGYAPLLPGVRFIPFGDIDAARAAITTRTAAFIVEPVQGNSGVRPASKDYMRAIRERCSDTGTLLIFDEIQTGFGRTGRWFAHEHAGVEPDIMPLAKPLGGGLPLGAMVAKAEIGDALTLGSHGTTCGGNPVACAAGLATLNILSDDGLIERSERLGAAIREELSQALGRVDAVVEVRGLGMMIGIELHSPAAPLREALFKKGLLVTLAGKNVLRLLPPLNIEQDLVDKGLRLIIDVLRNST